MKEIESCRYLKKKAIYGKDIPVGDPGLPGDMTEWDIPEVSDPDVANNKMGEAEILVNWPEFKEWFEAGGDDIPSIVGSRSYSTYILVSYRYNYDYDENMADDVRVLRIKDYETNQQISDPYFMESIGEYFEDDINNDIEVSEEDVKRSKNSSYGF